MIRKVSDSLEVLTKLKLDSHLPKKIFVCVTTESPLNMMTIAFYFILKALFVFKIFKFLLFI